MTEQHSRAALSVVDQDTPDRVQRTRQRGEHFELHVWSDRHLDPQIEAIGMMDQVCWTTVRGVGHDDTSVESRVIGPT
jgi:hypothetical protein